MSVGCETSAWCGRCGLRLGQRVARTERALGRATESTTAGLFAFGSSQHGSFSLGGTFNGATGDAFEGGPAPRLSAVTSEDVGDLAGKCGGLGVKLIHLGLGSFSV